MEGLIPPRLKPLFLMTFVVKEIVLADETPVVIHSRDVVNKSIVDPFVEVSLHSHSPFLPESATAAGASCFPSMDATKELSSRCR
jgi:hypothetical protein